MKFSIKILRDTLKGSLLVGTVAVGGAILLLIGFTFLARYRIGQKFEQLQSARASQFFAMNLPFQIGQNYRGAELKSLLSYLGYDEKKNAEDLMQREYAWESDGTNRVLTLFRPLFEGVGKELDRMKAKLTFEEKDGVFTLLSMFRVENGNALETLDLPPKKIGAYYAGRVRTANPAALSEIPVDVRHAVMAIEDVHFLEHAGVSIRGTVRALWRDIRERRLAEGGSTITQQLMKNLFFSREKALLRKIKEAFYALIGETFYSKEQILEAYLNEVYMGQWSTHEIHGVAEGARHYFNRPIAEISLAQSATLAAIIQAPNALDPRKAGGNTKKRRDLVLKKMLDANFILPDEYEMAVKEPMGSVAGGENLEDVGYFMDLVLDRLPEWVKRRLDTDGLFIYSTLNPYLQITASKVLKANLDNLTRSYKTIKKKKEKGIELQGALIAIDVPSCTVLALQGGKSYRQTQFNRVLQGKRQPGSLFKPFVTLAAFQHGSDGQPISPITEIDGKQFEWKYDKQVWKPRNYEKEYADKATVRKTLEDSLNVPTARLAQMIGVPAIVEALRAAGIRSNLPALPSLSLGSADVNPLEVAESYLTLANIGKSCSLRPFTQVIDGNRNIVFDNPIALEEKLPPAPTYQTVNIMKGVLSRGTARYAALSGMKVDNFAGKTGTTNDFKDAWFVGFSPQLLTLVWVGYDEEEKVGLTGAAAALPLWMDFVKSATPFLTNADFVAPEGVTPVEIDPVSLGIAKFSCPEKVTEYFQPGTAPSTQCMMH